MLVVERHVAFKDGREGILTEAQDDVADEYARCDVVGNLKTLPNALRTAAAGRFVGDQLEQPRSGFERSGNEQVRLAVQRLRRVLVVARSLQFVPGRTRE